MTMLEMLMKLKDCGDISVKRECYTSDDGLPVFKIMVEDYNMDEDVDLKLNYPELVEELKDTLAKQALEIVSDYQYAYFFENCVVHFQYRSDEMAILWWED